MKKMVGMLVIALLSYAFVCDAQERKVRNDQQPTSTQTVRSLAQEEVVLTMEEALKLIEAWDRVELHLRAAREDTSSDPAAQPCCNSADLAAIRTCICAIKNQLCVLTALVINETGLIGPCTDPVIPQVTDAACITQAEISAICASLQSWVKTIVSELRGNQTVCPT